MFFSRQWRRFDQVSSSGHEWVTKWTFAQVGAPVEPDLMAREVRHRLFYRLPNPPIPTAARAPSGAQGSRRSPARRAS